MTVFEEVFSEWFEPWGINLPQEAVARRRKGEIIEQGFYIQYLFGSDEKGNYMDVYSAHRMTNDRHKRVYENGDVKHLPAGMDTFGYDPDKPGDKERSEQEFYDYNRKVGEDLKKKGFK